MYLRNYLILVLFKGLSTLLVVERGLYDIIKNATYGDCKCQKQSPTFTSRRFKDGRCSTAKDVGCNKLSFVYTESDTEAVFNFKKCQSIRDVFVWNTLSMSSSKGIGRWINITSQVSNNFRVIKRGSLQTLKLEFKLREIWEGQLLKVYPNNCQTPTNSCHLLKIKGVRRYPFSNGLFGFHTDKHPKEMLLATNISAPEVAHSKHSEHTSSTSTLIPIVSLVVVLILVITGIALYYFRRRLGFCKRDDKSKDLVLSDIQGSPVARPTPPDSPIYETIDEYSLLTDYQKGMYASLENLGNDYKDCKELQDGTLDDNNVSSVDVMYHELHPDDVAGETQ